MQHIKQQNKATTQKLLLKVKNKYRYNTNGITGIVDNSQKRTLTIHGLKSDEFDHCRNEQQNINISHNAIPQYDIISGNATVNSTKNDIDVVVIGKKVPTQKRTMVVSEEVLKLWDEVLRDKPCKAEILSIAMERFIRDLQDGNVVIQFSFDVFQ